MTPEDFRKLRKAARLNQAQMAERLGVSRKTIVNWETGRFAIPEDVLDRAVERGLDPVPRSAPANPKLVKATLDAYRFMRNQPAPLGCHKGILEVWQASGFWPCPEAQQAILAEWPDILDPKPQT